MLILFVTINILIALLNILWEGTKGRSHMRPRMDFHLVLHGEYL